MANNNFLNTNSKYVGSLVSYLNDTKPYHSKLTEIAEEYQFFDTMAVKITEKTIVRTKVNPAWLYNFFSSGDQGANTLPLKQLHSPLASNSERYPGTDANADLTAIPYVYSKKAFDGIGVADVRIDRTGNQQTLEPLVEGIDYFQSHGSMQLQIMQTIDANNNFVPLWSEIRDANILSTTTAITQQLALDVLNPNSAVNQIKAILLQIEGMPNLSVITASELTRLLSITSIPALPRDYEPLLNRLVLDNVPPLPGYTSWIGRDAIDKKFVSAKLSSLTPSMYFGTFSDSDDRESGKADYADVMSSVVNLTNIVASISAVPGDTWRIVSAAGLIPVFDVISTNTGYIGSFTATTTGANFSSSTISFIGTHVSQAVLGFETMIENRNSLVFGPSAPREVWDIIKVNPIAYSRPALSSTRYGYIKDALGNVGSVSLLDPTLPTGTIILAARADGQYFDLTSSVDPMYTKVVQSNVLFDDGRVSFTIHSGSAQPFQLGDRFYINIVNDAAKVIGLDLGYGYDLDSYDAAGLVYNNTDPTSPDYLRPLNFVFDSRFTDYNLDELQLVVGEVAISGRKWRLRAIPNLARPIATLKKDGSGPNNSVDLQGLTSGIDGDVALNAAPLYSMLGDTNTAPDLKLFYADSFIIEHSDDNFNTVASLGIVPVGSSFTSPADGISFTLAAGHKPFVAVISDDGLINPAVEGGDVFSFGIFNSPPVLSETPVGLSSGAGARLIMHGAGFYEAPPALWSVDFTSPIDYTVQGLFTEGDAGKLVGQISGTLTTKGTSLYEGQSFNALGIHFTIVPGNAGLSAGDKFTFTTYSRKPSFLVHGSASGWQKDAIVGEPYWNGFIGFTIKEPSAALFNTALTQSLLSSTALNTWALGSGSLKISRLRFDAPHLVYTLSPIILPKPVPVPTGWSPTIGGWAVNRSDLGAVGYLSPSGQFTDKYITIDVQGVLSADVIHLQLVITPDNFALWNAQDAIVLRPKIEALLPIASDFVVVDKRTEDRLAINLRYGSVAVPPSIAALAPVQINPYFIDTGTGPFGIPLDHTSPETAILDNWLPLTLQSYDSSTSLAEFSDTAVRYKVVSAGSGETIGTLHSLSDNASWPAEFEWDLNFFANYLPLNAEANVVTYGSGFNELVHARISESIKFLVSGGALTTDFMFHDDVAVSIDEHNDWSIFTQMQDDIGTTVSDGPFVGFLPGYDNLPYDLETTDGYYDLTEGSLVISDFAPAQGLPSLSSQPTMGIPTIGMAMDITIGGDGADVNKPSSEISHTGVQDALVIIAVDSAYAHDTFGFDIGGLDSQSERSAIIYSGSLPPVGVPVPGASYDTFETPLAVIGDPSLPADFTARIFDINFNVNAGNIDVIKTMKAPQVFIWFPLQSSPQQVPVVEKVGIGKYRISVPTATEAKLYLQPGL